MSETSIWQVTYNGDRTDFERLRRAMTECGFARVDGIFTPAETAEMQREIGRVVDEFDPHNHPTTVFTTENDQRHIADRYFLDSVDNVSFFYEEGAVDAKSRSCLADKQRALNKIGHALHWLNPVFKKYTFSTRIQQLYRELRLSEPFVVQSMYIFKQPSIGGAVMPHIDATFLYADRTATSQPAPKTDSISGGTSHVVGAWIAIDAATVHNGCLHFVPGSHKTENDYKFVRNDGGGSLFKFVGTKPNYDSLDYVPVPVDSGSLVLIDGNVVHKSEANRSDKSRHAYTFHVFKSADAKWSPTNWIQETDNYKFPKLY